MTTGQLIESVLGKHKALTGLDIASGTVFEKHNIQKITQSLHELGFQRNGNEVMYHGATGKRIESLIFIGPTYYQRLKHLVSDKLHCLTMDHEVLTLNGWKFFNQLTLTDKIATLKEGELVYENPTNLHHYPNYKGKLYSISNTLIDLKVTEEHRMWVSKRVTKNKIRNWEPYEFIKAKDLVGKSVKYLKSAEWSQEDYQFTLQECSVLISSITSIEKQKIKVDMDAWLTFFGIWIAEGWTKSYTKKGYEINILD